MLRLKTPSFVAIVATACFSFAMLGGCPTTPQTSDTTTDTTTDTSTNTTTQQQTGPDQDGDGVADAVDNCPLTPNADQADANFDGIGNVCDATGIWKRVSGKLFASTTTSSNSTNHVEYIEFDGDGTGMMFLKDSETNLLVCGGINYGAALPNSIILDLSTFSTAVEGGFASGQKTLVYTFPDANTIAFVDAGGNESTYSRADSVPDDAKCKTLGLGNRFTFGVRPVSSWGSMAYDGASLWFTEQSTANLYPINPANGALGAAKTLAGGYSYLIACQGTDFWGSCACGSVSDVKRKTQAGVDVDVVDTAAAPISSQLTINCGAWDANNNVLWLAGSNSVASESRLMRINSNANPNVLIGVTRFNISMRALTFRGTELWGVTSSYPQSVVKIDTSTFKVIDTYAVPDLSVQWAGIAVVGTQLQLLGIIPGTGGVLQAINP